MLCVWWGVRGVIYLELLPENTTLTAAKYSLQLSKVAAKLEKKGINGNKIYFQHDNARPHVDGNVIVKLKQLNWKLLPNAPYSPNLSPSDYHLFFSLNDLRYQRSRPKKLHSRVFYFKVPEFLCKGHSRIT